MTTQADQPVIEGAESPPPGNAALRIADYLFGLIAGITLFAMMAMTGVDVIGRYLFNAPLGFAFEMTQLAMAVVVFAALPSVTLRSQHITVGLFENAVRGWAKVARDSIIAALIGACCLYLAWRLSTLAGRFVSYGDVTSVLGFPIGYVAWLGVAGLLMAVIASAVLIAKAVLERDGASDR